MEQTSLIPAHSLRKEIALLLSMVGTALSLVGLVATAWARPSQDQTTNPVREIGLWKYCMWVDPEDTIPQDCYNIADVDVPGWLHATQILCVLGFIFEFVTLLLTVISECASRCTGNKALVFAFVGTGFTSTIFVAAALVIFGTQVEMALFSPPEDLGHTSQTYTYEIAWAFIITGVGAGIQPICALLGIWDAAVESRKARASRDQSLDPNTPRGNHPYGSMTT